ncbi:MAG: hypothetical protein IJ489_08800 [Clostridia bacterium]|nr:hypothetical protein [Clostridia bacterium]
MKTQIEKMISSKGELRLLQTENGWKRAVELWLLNDAVNENSGRYTRLSEHRALFAGTPILVAYVDGKIGDGHNFEQVIEKDGSVSASFLSETAERIVGYFDGEEDIRLEKKDGKTWIVGKGYIWKWYARELTEKLERGKMAVSIETLIDEYHMEGMTEIYDRYQILGTTILGDGVAPAVKNANIKVLSAIGADSLRSMALRVASANEAKMKNKSKGVQTMKIKELQKHFGGYKVLSVEGEKIALLADNGSLYLSSARKQDGEVIIGAKVEVNASLTLGEGENSISIPVDTLTETLNHKIETLTSDLEAEKSAKEKTESALLAMQTAEKARRRKLVKDAVANRLKAINENLDEKIEETVCNSILTDERVVAFSDMEENGEFCGDARACRELDALCMDRVIANNGKKANAAKKHFAWNDAKDDEDESKGVLHTLTAILD